MSKTTIERSTTESARGEIEANLLRLYAAWQARDEAGIRALFSDRDELMLWGTDAFERIVGRSEADAEFVTWIATCPPWTAMASTHRVIGIGGDLVWVADEVEGRWANDTEAGTEHFRVTTVWENGDGSWRLVHANVASPH
jgi:ketosteroid isomerase-like protein